MPKLSGLTMLLVLVFSSSGCAATHTGAPDRLGAPATSRTSRLQVENHTNANLEIYAVLAGTRTRHPLGQVRSLRRAFLPLPPVVLSESEAVYLIAVPVGLLDQIGFPTQNRTLVHPESLRLRPGQHIVWRLTGIDSPRVSSVSVF